MSKFGDKHNIQSNVPSLPPINMSSGIVIFKVNHISLLGQTLKDSYTTKKKKVIIETQNTYNNIMQIKSKRIYFLAEHMMHF